MGKRNRLRRQSIRELPLIVGPLPLPESRLFADEEDVPAGADASGTRTAESSLVSAPDAFDEDAEERPLVPGGEPLPR